MRPTGGVGRWAPWAFTAGALFAGWLLAEPGLVHAYTIASAASSGCHEKITSDALRAVRLELASAAPLPADRNEQALIDDLPFTPDSDMGDLGGATLLVSVRDNDLKGRDAFDLSQLALVHGDPGAQREHCLRSLHEKEPDGSNMGLLDCRAFIRERLGQALDGLDAAGAPDLTKRTSLPLYLALRHGVDASLPTFYVRVGQAIHAIEDSFTHTFRSSPDGMKITVLLDWVDEANGNLVESSDGPPHSSELDRCDDPDDLRRGRRELATEAAAAVLRTTLDPSKSKDQKMAAVEVILDQYLGYSPGCTFDNGWCQAAEHIYGNGQSGCSVGGPENPASGLGWGSAVIVGSLVLLRRGRRRGGRGTAALVALTAFSIGTIISNRAFAEVASDPSPQPTVTSPVKESSPAGQSQKAFGGYLGGSGSLDHGAVAGAIGARLRLNKHWTLGLDAEWNPWIAVSGGTSVRAGALNVYETTILRIPLAYEKFNLRITANAGFSRLLIDLYGAPKGSTGIYLGFSPLGLEWKMSRIFYLVLNPLNVAVPAPQLKGVPFSYS
ncbi:MAG: hypothetical protein QOI66_4995, partial [Myxococcales bacterium]|nr:hypothetical protein [Myxococcales bacterium]